jgi:hypothetical protein
MTKSPETIMSHTLCVDGLPPWITSGQLNLLCLLYGQTISAEVITDREGRSLQFGLVEMATEEDARQVITALDGTDELDATSRIVYVAKICREDDSRSHLEASESRRGELVFG